jgi:hypothetical protein
VAARARPPDGNVAISALSVRDIGAEAIEKRDESEALHSRGKRNELLNRKTPTGIRSAPFGYKGLHESSAVLFLSHELRMAQARIPALAELNIDEKARVNGYVWHDLSCCCMRKESGGFQRGAGVSQKNSEATTIREGVKFRAFSFRDARDRVYVV